MGDWDFEDIDHLSRSADHLGALANVLKDLGGPETILNELTQNADDAEDASTIRFAIEPNELSVWNDGVFSNCGAQNSPTCPYLGEGRRSCDLHSFRLFSGRHKGGDSSTTGAFGVGFTCVYHVTDHPELVTAGTHLLLDEAAAEKERIRVCKDPKCHRDHGLPGTTFYLPWARTSSELRLALQVQPVSEKQIAELESAFRGNAAATILFLRRINTIKIKGPSGSKTVRRDPEDDIVRVTADKRVEEWLLLEGSYDTSEKLKHQYRDIEPARSELVQVAIRLREPLPGRFYAGLPSQMATGWNGHINGSFYPRTDRKSFEFSDGTYRSEWNLDLLDSAAHLIAGHLGRITELAGVDRTWEILRDLQRLDRDVKDGKQPAGFDKFYETVAARAPESSILLTVGGEMRKPSGCVLPVDASHYAAAAVVNDLGLPVVAPGLRSIVSETAYKRYGISQLTAGRLIEHLHDDALLTEVWEVGDGDNELEDAQVDLLLELLESLLDRAKAWLEEADTSELALLPCLGPRYAPAADALRIDRPELVELFAGLDPDMLVVDESRLSARAPALLTLVPELDVPTALEVAANPADPDLLEANADELIAWLDQRRDELKEAGCSDIARSLPIFPASDGSRASLDRLSVPSSFEDVFGVAELVDSEFAQNHWPLLAAIGAEELTAVEYLTKHILPRLDALAPDASDLELVLDLIYDARRELEDDSRATALLRAAPLIPCTDGEPRPGHKVHMPNPLVSLINPDAPIADLAALSEYLHDTVVWLGASEGVTHELVNQAALRLAEGPDDPDPTVCEAVLEAVDEAPGEFESVPAELANLRNAAWLPREGGGRDRPANLYPVFQSYLFESQGPKLGLSRAAQNNNADTLYWLGMPHEPTVAMVVAHLRHCVKSGHPINRQVYVWLGRQHPAAIANLREEACIQVAEGKYVHPRQVFWQPTELGRWASQLPHDMRDLQPFMDAVGVSEVPETQDVDYILTQIAKEAGTSRLDPQDELVVHECWALLNNLLNADAEPTERTLKVIGRRPSYPDPRGILAKPERLLFRDPRRLVDQIALLVNDVVDRERRTQRALEIAGVTRAEDVIEVEAVEVVSTDDTEFVRLRHERRLALLRAIESVAMGHPDSDIDSAALFDLEVHRAEQLKVVYRATVGSQKFETPPQAIDAILLEDEFRVVHTASRNRIPVARELSRAIAPYLDPSVLAPLLVTILEAESAEDAMARLDDYGVAAVLDVERATVTSALAVEVDAEEGHLSDEDIVFGQEERLMAPHSTDDEPVAGEDAEDYDDDSLSDEPQEGIGEGESRVGGSSIDSRGQRSGSSSTQPARERGAKQSSASAKRRASGGSTHMASYVLFGDQAGRPRQGDEAPDNDAIDRAGVNRVLAYEQERGRDAEQQAHENPGFDVLSRKDGEIVRRVEVKSIRGEWTLRGVMLSPRQFKEATEHRDQFWLYVVENAEDDDLFRIHRIQDPASRIDYFGFDSGWIALREEDFELDEEGAPAARHTRNLLGQSPGQTDDA